MMGFICMLFPPILFCYIREKLNFNNAERRNIIRLALEYVTGTILVNLLVYLVAMTLFKSTGNYWTKISEYPNFAVNYLVLSTVFACVLPYAEKYLREKVTFSVNVHFVPVGEKIKTVILWFIAICMMLCHFVRLFDNSVWGDEGIVVVSSRYDFMGMLRYVASCGHSPFHYTFAWICVKLFGEAGFVYHLSASLPYFITMIVSATIIRKWFGNKASILLMTLCTFLSCAVTYNLEIRMYAWCQLFVLLTFLMNCGVYRTGKTKYYILMTLFAIGAVYSHYFAIASIGILCFGLLLYQIKLNWKKCWKVIVAGISVLLALLPWLLYANSVRGTVISNYGIGKVKTWACIQFILSTPSETITTGLLVGFLITLLVVAIYELRIVAFTMDGGRRHIKINIDGNNIRCSSDLWWMVAGTFAVLGTIVLSQLFSKLFYNITILRYLYVSYVIVWLVYCVGVSRLKLSKIWSVILLVVILVNCVPNYSKVATTELSNNSRLKSTLEATRAEIDENDYIYTDIVHFAWTVASAYYPDTPHNLFGHAEWWGPLELSDLDPETDYWLFLSTPISESVIENLEDLDCTYEMVVEKGYIGTGNVWVYKVIQE